MDTGGIELSSHLRERVRVLNEHGPRAGGELVLYWMHHAVRAHENPALDVALTAADTLRVPLLVYQGLGGNHRYNSDRHHVFILEGARDVQRQLAARGLTHALHVPRAAGETSPLRSLAARAALVVVEDFPAPPFKAWNARIAAATPAAVWAVDGHCIVPMGSVPEPYTRAFRFRDRIKAELDARVPRPWTETTARADGFTGDLGFEGIDLDRLDIADLVARCDIDHGVGPVHHTPGGSQAGYARWDAFKRHGLEGYARLRNDAAVEWPRGVSRMSAYLHHGHVSPLRIAREAAEIGGDGARKFLDELLVWRELAHNYCRHHEDLESLGAIPDWARKTLVEHANDPRPARLSWEELARGRTGDALWDLAQRSLIAHGELHNNLRMTWGKALLGWTGDPKEALERLLDLNHRYALDGNDPNSYGGLLWCLGQFDRPFEPAQPVFGTVRPRSTRAHGKRLDMAAYSRKVSRSSRGEPLRVAVIGAGMSGLVAARILQDHHHRVTVYEKARGPGGRMSTRRAGEQAFDHGAQYFTARDPRFQRLVQSWREQGVVAPWEGRIGVYDGTRHSPKSGRETRWVGVPGISAVTRHLATDLSVVAGTRVEAPKRRGDRWLLRSEGEDLGEYDAVIVATPAPQAAALLGEVSSLAESLAQVLMGPTWAVMVPFPESLEARFDGLFVNAGPLSWVARNSAKPGRPRGDAWVLHGSPEWSATHRDADPRWVGSTLTDTFLELVGYPEAEPGSVSAHRWLYAVATNPLSDGCLWDLEGRIGACGDWAKGARVEGAVLSGMAMSGRVLAIS